MQKLDELQKATLEVQVYENYIDRLVSIHKDCSEKYDWDEISKRKYPEKPIFDEPPKMREVPPIHDAEKHYQKLMDDYVANIWEKIIGQDKRKRKLWEKLLKEGIAKDLEQTASEMEKAKDEYKTAVQKHEKKREETQRKYEGETNLIQLSQKITEGDLSAYAYVIESVNPFEEIAEFGSDIDCTVISKTEAKAVINVNDTTVIPKQAKTLLKSGKVSLKDMPVGKFNEIYQDYVCSAVIRIAREFFSILPLEKIIVTASGSYFNSSTGNEEEGPLLSALFDRKTMEKLNFDAIDPSDSMQNFKCNMNFKKTKGMAGTEDVDF